MFKRGSVGVVVGVVVAGVVLAVGGCGGGADGEAGASGDGAGEASPARAPSKKLVKWVGDVCESTAVIKGVRKDSTSGVNEVRDAEKDGTYGEGLAVSYVARTPSEVEDVERDMKDLGPSGVPAADKLLGAWQKKLKEVAADLGEMSPSDAFDDAEGSAEDVDKLVQSLTPPTPDLPALTKKDPRLAAAYKRAEQCAPGWKPEDDDKALPSASDGPLPKAKDGKDTGACGDGECEVLVKSSADVSANGVSVHVSVDDNSVTFQSAGTLMQLGGAGGEANFGNDLRATVVAHNKDGAVLKFTIP